MKEAVRLLAQETEYDVRAQDLTYRMNRMRVPPESGFVITKSGRAHTHPVTKAVERAVSAARV